MGDIIIQNYGSKEDRRVFLRKCLKRVETWKWDNHGVSEGWDHGWRQKEELGRNRTWASDWLCLCMCSCPRVQDLRREESPPFQLKSRRQSLTSHLLWNYFYVVKMCKYCSKPQKSTLIISVQK